MRQKVALVTGASRGIGRAVAEKFASEGYAVAVNYLQSEEQAEELAHRLGGLAVKADVADGAAVRAMAETVRRELGTIDALVCNAGVAQQGLFTDLTETDWKRLLDVNLSGVFHCCQAVLPGMISRKEGAIVTLSSIWGLVGASCEVAYSACKAGVIGLTKALAKEVGPSGIRVNCVAPGVVDTDMNRQLDRETLQELRAETPLEMLGTPQDIAQAVWFLASPQAQFITGQVLSPNGGFVI